MKKLLYMLILPVLMLACEKYPMPGSETLESFNYMIIGNNQSAESGQYLTNGIGVQINLESLFPKTDKKFHMVLEITSGNGTVDKSIVQADNNGKMLTRWKLGNDENDQQIKGMIYDSSDRFYSEFEIQATAFFMDKLNTIKTGYLVGIQDMVRDTVAQRTMMVKNGQIWALKNEFYSWEQKEWYFNTNVRMIDKTSDGTVFAAGWNGALYKTENWGDNWQYVCDPFPGSGSFYNFNITSDDYLWATKASFGVYCSKDKGLTWTQDTTKMISTGYLGPIYKYGNSYLCMSNNPMSIIKTSDDGITWETVNTPEASLSMFVPNDSTIIAQNQGGFILNKSTDDGESYKQVFVPSTTMGGGNLWHVYNKFENNFYVLAPGGGVWKTRDFDKFEPVLKISSYQQKLFIDHMGNIYVVGDAFINAEDEATFIIPK
jgi:photosystem II stability/assembly factor-like uncharacterized protein